MIGGLFIVDVPSEPVGQQIRTLDFDHFLRIHGLENGQVVYTVQNTNTRTILYQDCP